MRRLIELSRSDDQRVATVACNAVLDRAWGKVREFDLKRAEDTVPPRFDPSKFSPDQLELGQACDDAHRASGRTERPLAEQLAASGSNGPIHRIFPGRRAGVRTLIQGDQVPSPHPGNRRAIGRFQWHRPRTSRNGFSAFCGTPRFCRLINVVTYLRSAMGHLPSSADFGV
jgi:hypothetical protein